MGRPNAGIRKKPPGRKTKTFTDGNVQVYKLHAHITSLRTPDIGGLPGQSSFSRRYTHLYLKGKTLTGGNYMSGLQGLIDIAFTRLSVWRSASRGSSS